MLSTGGNDIGVTSPYGATMYMRIVEAELDLAGVTSKDTAAGFLPAGSVVLNVTSRVTEAIVGSDATGFSVGDAATAARFSSGSALTADTTENEVKPMLGVVAATADGPSQAAAGIVRVTLTGGTPTAATSGKVRVAAHILVMTPPTA